MFGFKRRKAPQPELEPSKGVFVGSVYGQLFAPPDPAEDPYGVSELLTPRRAAAPQPRVSLFGTKPNRHSYPH